MASLQELKRQFLEHCELEKGRAVLTIENYDRYISRFLDYLAENNSGAELTPANITQEIVRKYRLHVNRLTDQEGLELKLITQNYHILALRAFLRYLSWRGIETLAPEKVPVAKTGDREISFLGGEEVSGILEKPDTTKVTGLRDRAILEVLFSTGMRVSELAALDTSDINFDRGEISVLGKGKKIRVVFLSDSAVYWIDQYDKNKGHRGGEAERPEAPTLRHSDTPTLDPLLLSPKGERLTVRSIERIVKKYAGLAGITKKCTPHTLRHSFATDLLINGADIRSVQSMLGHSSITTTQIYTHVTDQHLREVHQKFHGKK
ncbi:MAG: tyrosine-type recombinase/integrase [Patescibacteria group bacterium]